MRDEIDVHLAGLYRSGLITSWHDAMIIPGTTWEQEIEAHLKTASIILLLVSPDFINSDYCYGNEMLRAIERHDRHEARVIPIIIRPVDWADTPFSKIQMLPTDAKPVTEWNNRDTAFADIARGIRRVVKELIAQREQREKARQRQQEKAQKQHPKPGIQPIPSPPPGNSNQSKNNALQKLTNIDASARTKHTLLPQPALSTQPSNLPPRTSAMPSSESIQISLAQLKKAPILQPSYYDQASPSTWHNQPSTKQGRVISRRNLLLSGGILLTRIGGGISLFSYLAPFYVTPFIYKGHSDSVNGVTWSPNGTHIASASGDHTVQVWKVL